MRIVKSIAWLDQHRWGVRAFNNGRSQYRGFKFNRAGVWTKCPDWDATPRCGGGFHLMTATANGAGFFGRDIELVEYRGEPVVIDGNKAKVSELRRVKCTRAILYAALTRCDIHVITKDCAVTSGLYVCWNGSPAITQSGGKVWCRGASTPRITQSGGEVWCCDTSTPRITQSGGEVWCFSASTPRITQSGGEVWCRDTSTPRITQSGGKVWCFSASTPRITQSGGKVWTYDRSAPRITQSGGSVCTYDRSAPRITNRK